MRYGVGKYLVESLLPEYYWNSNFIDQFMMAMGNELEFFLRFTVIPSDDVAIQALTTNGLPTPLETIVATWYVRLASGNRLAYWEALLGIFSDPTLTDTQRQTTILNQIRNRGQSPTVQYINSLVQRYVTQSVTQDQFSDPTLANYNFRVRIIQPRGVPATLNLIQSDLNQYAPQHLAYIITYTETDWAGLAARDWATLGNTSWSTMSY